MSTAAKWLLVAVLIILAHAVVLTGISSASDSGSYLFIVPFGQMERARVASLASAEAMITLVILPIFAILLFRHQD